MADTQDRPAIAVVGATGAQGGGLARAILADPQRRFHARALTRHPDGDKARALAALGAEIVACDIDDRESVIRAFGGAHGAYCVTPFWEHMSPERELMQARTMAEAAHATGLRHVVWSTLEDTRAFVPLDDDRMPTLMERYKVPHFDVKAEADAIFLELGVPVTFLMSTFYWDNFLYLGMGPKPAADGTLTLSLPMADKRLAGIAADDIGKTALALFARGLGEAGERVAIAGECLTGAQMAEKFSASLGRPVRYVAIAPQDYRDLGFPGADDIANMFQFYAEFESAFCGARDVDATRRLNPELQSFDAWLARNAGAIPLE